MSTGMVAVGRKLTSRKSQEAAVSRMGLMTYFLLNSDSVKLKVFHGVNKLHSEIAAVAIPATS